MLASRVVHARDQVLTHSAGGRHHLGGRDACHGDTILVYLLREPLAEPLQRRLLCPVTSASPGAWRLGVRASSGAYGRALRYVDDAAASLVRPRELELERAASLAPRVYLGTFATFRGFTRGVCFQGVE